MPTLKEMRDSKGLKAKYVAKHIGVSERTYFSYEHAHSRIPVEKAKTLCDLLDCRIEDVLSKDESFFWANT